MVFSIFVLVCIENLFGDNLFKSLASLRWGRSSCRRGRSVPKSPKRLLRSLVWQILPTPLDEPWPKILINSFSAKFCLMVCCANVTFVF